MAEIFTIQQGGGSELLDMLDEVTDLYLAIRAEPAYTSAPSSIYTRESFVARTTGQSARDGFAITTARPATGELVGFAFGLTFPAGGWWSGHPTVPPAEILDVPKFAVIELDVAEAWRGRGIARRLMDELLDGRPEPYAVLTAVADAPARQIYARWGWQQVGTAQHTPDAPIMDQLVLSLQ